MPLATYGLSPWSNCPTSYLAKLYRSIDAGTNWIEQTTVISISAPRASLNIIRRPYLSTPNAHIEKCAGLIDSGSFSATLEYYAAQHEHLVELFQGRTAFHVKIALANGDIATGWVIIRDFPLMPEAPEDGRLITEVTFEISGKMIYTKYVAP